MKKRRIPISIVLVFVFLLFSSASAFWISDDCKTSEIPYVFPLDLPVRQYKISSGYGWRVNPVTKLEQFHKALDILAEEGTPVYATISGKVTQCSIKESGYGLTIVIENKWFSIKYAHLSKPEVIEGMYVKQGDLVAFSGNSGEITTGPHLHYEISKYMKKQNSYGSWIYWWDNVNPQIFINLGIEQGYRWKSDKLITP